MVAEKSIFFFFFTSQIRFIVVPESIDKDMHHSWAKNTKAFRINIRERERERVRNR